MKARAERVTDLHKRNKGRNGLTSANTKNAMKDAQIRLVAMRQIETQYR